MDLNILLLILKLVGLLLNLLDRRFSKYILWVLTKYFSLKKFELSSFSYHLIETKIQKHHKILLSENSHFFSNNHNNPIKYSKNS